MATAEVEAWFARHTSALTPLVLATRAVFLGAAPPRIGEYVKWQVPAITDQGNIASFLLCAKARFGRMLHSGG